MPVRSTRPIALLRRAAPGIVLWAGLALVLAQPGQARAEVHGGIEIGAKGVKATVIDLTAAAEGDDVKVRMGKTANTTLSAGLARTGRFDPEALRATVGEVARFHRQMRDEYQVPEGRIHVVASSGLFAGLGEDADKIQAAHAELAKAVRNACGAKLDFLDARREAELSILGTVPRRYTGSALLLDVGSGNTKGGYREKDGGRFVTLAVPFGSVTLVKRAGKGELAPVVAELRQNLRAQIARTPGVTSRERVYLSGGACWALATLMRPEDRQAFVKLTARDVANYRRRLRENPATLLKPDLSALPEDVRKQATAEVGRVRAVFTPENLQAGAEILQALADECRLAESGKTLYFARNAQLAWLLAYVAEAGRQGK